MPKENHLEEHVRRCDCQEFYPMHRPNGSQCKDLTPCRRCGKPIRCDGKRSDNLILIPHPVWREG